MEVLANVLVVEVMVANVLVVEVMVGHVLVVAVVVGAECEKVGDGVEKNSEMGFDRPAH